MNKNTLRVFASVFNNTRIVIQRIICNAFTGLKEIATTIALIGLVTATPGLAAGQGAEAAYFTSHLQAGHASIQYSKSSGGVGIVLVFAPWQGGPSVEAIGNRFVELFREQGSDAKVFVVRNDKPGLAVSFTTYDVGIGPFTPNEAVANIGDAIAQNEAAKRLHAASAAREGR